MAAAGSKPQARRPLSRLQASPYDQRPDRQKNHNRQQDRPCQRKPVFNVSPGGHDQDPDATPAKLPRRHEQCLQPPVQHRVKESAEKHFLGQRSDCHSKNHHQVRALPVLEKLVHGQRLRNRQQPRNLSQTHRQERPARHETQPAHVPWPAPSHGLPERTLPVTRHQHIHGDQHGHVSQRHARDNHQRPRIFAQFGGRNTVRG